MCISSLICSSSTNFSLITGEEKEDIIYTFCSRFLYLYTRIHPSRKVLNKSLNITFNFFFRVSDNVRGPVKDEDADVAQERERINKGGNKNDILLIRDLSKVSDFCIFIFGQHFLS